MNVAPIAEAFRRDQFDYKLLTHRTFHHHGYVIAIYSQGKEGEVWAYEVMRARFQSARTAPNGWHYADGYKLPSNERWGRDGWTYMTLQRAKAKFDALLEEALIPQAA